MPTVTTTVTSADATGVTTTQTTTVATPEAPTAAPKIGPVAKGIVMNRQHFKTKTAGVMDQWIDMMEVYLGMLNANGGDSFGYAARKGPTEMVMLWILTSEDDLAWIEGLVSADERVPALMPDTTASAVLCGAITPKVQAMADKWDAPDGWSVVCFTEPAFMFCDNTRMSADGLCALSDFEFNTEAECDEYIAMADSVNQLLAIRCINYFMVKTAPTKIAFAWTFKSAADVVGYIDEDLSMAAAQPILAAILKCKVFGGTCFGNIVDPAILAALAKWPTWGVAPLVAGARGGQKYQMANTNIYKSAAARDKAWAAFEAAKAKGAVCEGAYYAVKVGEASIWTVHYGKNEADNKGIQAWYGGNADLMASTKDLIHLGYWEGGHCQKTWCDDIKEWQKAIPTITIMDYPLIYTRTDGTYGPQSMTFMAEMEFKDEAGYKVYMGILADPEVINCKTKFWSMAWKTSPTTVTYMNTYGSSDDWLAQNAIWGKFAEKMATAFANVTVHVSGPVSAEAKTALGMWTSADWCNIVYADRSGHTG